MEFTPSSTDDRLIAAILSIGLRSQVLSKADAILWADQEIEQRPEAATWLIDLSLSNCKDLPSVDIAQVLEGIGRTADPREVCTGIFSLVPDLAGCTYDECHAVARQLYQITRCAFKGDFSCPFLLEAMEIEEQFDGWKYGTCTHEELTKQLREFVETKSDDVIRNRLKPLKYVLPKLREVG